MVLEITASNVTNTKMVRMGLDGREKQVDNQRSNRFDRFPKSMLNLENLYKSLGPLLILS